MIGTADLHAAIEAKWNTEVVDSDTSPTDTLNDIFKALWNPQVDANQFTVLSDTESSPHQPFPYCICQTELPRVLHRMTGEDGCKREIRNVKLTFKVFADVVQGDKRSAKQIAGYLAEQVMKVFGGHPTKPATEMELTNGGTLPSQFGVDYSVRDENLYKWIWVIQYNLMLDVPVAI